MILFSIAFWLERITTHSGHRFESNQMRNNGRTMVSLVLDMLEWLEKLEVFLKKISYPPYSFNPNRWSLHIYKLR